jgi:hypothetical protein
MLPDVRAPMRAQLLFASKKNKNKNGNILVQDM